MLFAEHIAVLAAAGYLLGSVPFGLLIGAARGIDIRAHGSGNIGATNVWRVLGKSCGLLTFFCDGAKGLASVALARWISAGWPAEQALAHAGAATVYFDPAAAGITAAIGCILGHTFPVWLRFKGGKGVATSLGVVIGMMPLASILVLALWAVIFKITRYVSLASLLAALALPLVVLGLLFAGAMRGWGSFYFALAAALLIVIRHRGNIQRLIAGTERRFGSAQPSAPSVAKQEENGEL